MSKAVSKADVLIEALVEEARAEAASDHLETDEILAYHAGDLDAAAEERLQNHLVSCRRCAAQLLDYDALADHDQLPEEGVADFEVLASWRELQGRIEEQKRASWFASPRFAAAVAAACLVAMVGLSAANLRLRGTVARLTGHQANPAVIRLDALTYRSDGAVPDEELPAEGEFFLLQISLDDEFFAEYELEVAGLDDEEPLQIGGLIEDGGFLRVRLHRSGFPAGEYSLRLYGLDGEERRLLREYQRRIRYPDDVLDHRSR